MSNEQRDQNINRSLFFIAIGCLIFLAAALFPNLTRVRAQSRLRRTCKSSLKNIGTAMEMYSTDWEGKYPSNLSQLTPKYLKTIPDCPAVGRPTYALTTGATAYNSPGFEDYYFIECAGENHTAISVPANYPQYDCISGLIER